MKKKLIDDFNKLIDYEILSETYKAILTKIYDLKK